MAEERRKHKRYPTPDLQSNISDGSGSFLVVVEDVSRSGVGMAQVPEGFDETVHKCFAVINAPLKDFKLTLQPRWVHATDEGRCKRIGFQIDEPSAEWLEFLREVGGREEKGEEERSDRHSLQGLLALISDGEKTYFGVVENLSEKGLRLSNVPADFNDAATSCTVTLQSPTGDVKVSMHPCWIRSTNRGMYKTMGLRIHNPPEGWQELIEELGRDDSSLGLFVVGEEKKKKPGEE
ncbi:MAG: hypothetical protein Kow0089_14740 [Desulfobulbaceae bacterium]